MAFPMTMLKINKCEQYQDVAMKTCKKRVYCTLIMVGNCIYNVFCESFGPIKINPQQSAFHCKQYVLIDH